MHNTDKNQVLSVSAALAYAKSALEQVAIRVVGEVSELSVKPGYKAVYFTIKDERASLQCMMWNNRYYAAGVSLAIGQMVELTGCFTLYAVKGRMNFDVKTIELAGEGKLRLQVAKRARTLEAEGLMNPARKRALPAYPQTIGLVTSPRGAAIHDVLRTLRRRFPIANVVVAGVAVEGVNAAQGIVAGIHCVVEARVEVVCVVRGGGTFEDLMPFNDEALARTIADCPVPVVTGIGHEPDTTIADMVADVRASTPTAAAEALSPSREDLEQLFEAYAQRLTLSVAGVLRRSAAELRHLAVRPLFCDANVLLASDAQSVDIFSDRLLRAIPANLKRDDARLKWQTKRLGYLMSVAGVRHTLQLDHARDKLLSIGETLVANFEQGLVVFAARLSDLSPLATIARGYCIVRTDMGSVVRCIEDAPVASVVEISVSDGVLTCEVNKAQRLDTEIVVWEDRV